MFFKRKGFKYSMGIILFVVVLMVGFVKINTVYSSTGLSRSSDGNNISTINDNAFISIYEEGYGYDVVLKIGDKDRTFSIKFPWKNDNSN